MASPTTNKGYTYPAHGGGVGTWDTNLNGNIEYQDLNLGGYYQITASSTTAAVTFNSSYATIPSTATSITFSASIAQNLFYNLLGTRSQNLSINMPAVGSIYCFANNSSGATTTTVLPTGGTGVDLPLATQTLVVTTSTGANRADNHGVFPAAITCQSVTASSAITAQSVTASSAIAAQSVAASSAITAQTVTASSALSGTIAQGSMIASSATQATGTSTNTLVAPAYQRYSPTAAKAWARCIGGGGGGLDVAYGIASNTRTSVGDYEVSFTSTGVEFANGFYSVVVTAIRVGATIATLTTLSSDVFTVNFKDAASNDVDPQSFCVVVYGTLV